MSVATAYDWVSAGLFVGTVLPMPGLIFGSALGLAIASRGRLGHKTFLFPPIGKTSRRLVQAGAGVAMAGVPTTMMLEREIEEVSLSRETEKVAKLESVQKFVVASSLIALQLAGGAVGYKTAWQIARRLKWTV